MNRIGIRPERRLDLNLQRFRGETVLGDSRREFDKLSVQFVGEEAGGDGVEWNRPRRLGSSRHLL